MLATSIAHLPSPSPYLLGVLTFSAMCVAMSLRYGLWAGGGYLLTRWLSRHRPHRRIQGKDFSKAQLRRELTYSLTTILIFAAVLYGVFAINAVTGWLQIYRDLSDYSMAWFCLSVPLALLIHDLYFYLIHRLMHQRGLYRRVHRVHHLSTNPSPLAAFAFHPLEALLEVSAVVVVTLLLPIHPYALALWGLSIITFNVLGHLGFEVYPAWVTRSRWLWWLNTPTGHNLHHSHFTGHYGLYTLIWDRLFGTLHPAYADVWDRVQGQVRAGKEARSGTSGRAGTGRGHRSPQLETTRRPLG